MINPPILELQDVMIGYKKTWLLKHVDLTVRAGEIIGLMGRSGSGKTTLMRSISGIETKNLHITGKILLNGINVEEIAHRSQYLTTIYQNPINQLIFSKTKNDIVFGMENQQFSKKRMEERLIDIVNSFGINHLLERHPTALSGGEQQLIVLASALAMDKKLVLLDEAFSALTEKKAMEVIKIVKQFKGRGTSFLMVEHKEKYLQTVDSMYYIRDKILEKV